MNNIPWYTLKLSISEGNMVKNQWMEWDIGISYHCLKMCGCDTEFPIIFLRITGLSRWFLVNLYHAVSACINLYYLRWCISFPLFMSWEHDTVHSHSDNNMIHHENICKSCWWFMTNFRCSPQNWWLWPGQPASMEISTSTSLQHLGQRCLVESRFPRVQATALLVHVPFLLVHSLCIFQNSDFTGNPAVLTVHPISDLH